MPSAPPGPPGRGASGLLVVLHLNGQISGMAAVVLGGVAGVLLMTSAVGTYPADLPFGMDTPGKAPA